MSTSRQKSRAARRLVSAFITISSLAGAGSASAAPHCDAQVTFDALAEGDKFTSDAVPEGSLLFAEDGIRVRSARIQYGGGKWGYDAGSVAAAPTTPCAFGSGLVFQPENFGLTFDLTGLGYDVAAVSVRWLDRGGIENLRVNGSDTYIGNLASAPSDIAPGVSCRVSSGDCGFDERGGITLVGPVRRFTLAGQELSIDNICVLARRPGTHELVALTIDDGMVEATAAKSATDGTSWGALKAQYR